jgi:hypothetical protein
VSRAAVSFAAISAAEADIERVATDIRRRIADLDRDLAVTVAGLPADDADRIRDARARRDAAVGDLCAVLDQIGTALRAARKAGQPSAYAQPGWSSAR